MTQLFTIDSPERLRQISMLSKVGSSDNISRVWSASRRRTGGESPLDGQIIVSFYTEGLRKISSVVFLCKRGEPEEIMRLKYTPALHFCWEHLRRIRT